jgi:hypothetical protein
MDCGGAACTCRLNGRIRALEKANAELSDDGVCLTLIDYDGYHEADSLKHLIDNMRHVLQSKRPYGMVDMDGRGVCPVCYQTMPVSEKHPPKSDKSAYDLTQAPGWKHD